MTVPVPKHFPTMRSARRCTTSVMSLSPQTRIRNHLSHAATLKSVNRANSRIRSGIRVGYDILGSRNADVSNIREIGREAAENPFQPQCPSLQVAIAESAGRSRPDSVSES